MTPDGALFVAEHDCFYMSNLGSSAENRKRSAEAAAVLARLRPFVEAATEFTRLLTFHETIDPATTPDSASAVREMVAARTRLPDAESNLRRAYRALVEEPSR